MNNEWLDATLDVVPVGRAVEADSLGEQTYLRLRSDIVQCALLPGAEVTESELAAQYEIGKAPIRVALTRLTQDGLVRPVPRRGYVVVPITIKDVQDLFDMRAVIEPALCRRAVGRLDPCRLRQMIDPPASSPDAAGRDLHLEWNQRFHVLFAAGSGNQVGTTMLDALLRRATRVTYLGLFARAAPAEQLLRDRHESRQEHKEMIEALERGDAEAVERLVRKHVETGRRMALDALVKGRASAQL